MKTQVKLGLVDALKEILAQFYPVLLAKVKEEIGKREGDALSYVLDIIYKNEQVRWYDPYHILLATRFAVQLAANTNKQVSPLVIPSAILHDIGYRFLPEFNDQKDSKLARNRILHMQHGAAMAAAILGFIDDYKADEIAVVVGMVGSHDNLYLGISTENPDHQHLIDADRTFVMHPFSFYREGCERVNFSLADLLRSRATTFYSPNDPIAKRLGKARETTAEDKMTHNRPPFTVLAKEWRDKQFSARWQEIQESITSDVKTFREYIEKHILSEIEAGRG